MTALLMMLLSSPADAGFGDTGGSSVTFSNLNPTTHAVVMDGQPLVYIPQLQGFVGVGLAPGAHTFQLMTTSGQVVMQTSYSVNPNTHEDCAMIPQGASFLPNCAQAAHPPYTAGSLSQFGVNVSAGAGGVSVSAPGLNVNINTGGGFGVTTTTQQPPPPQQPAAPQPIAEPQLQQLIQAVKDASFSDDQVSVIRTAASRNHFTCAQAVRLLEILSFSDAKVQAAQALKPAIVDPQNAFQLEAAFSFSSDKEQIRALFR